MTFFFARKLLGKICSRINVYHYYYYYYYCYCYNDYYYHPKGDGDGDDGEFSKSIQVPSSTHPGTTHPVRTNPHSDQFDLFVKMGPA